MLSRTGLTARLSAAALAAVLFTSGGCYKSDYEAAQAAREEAERRAKELEAELTRVRSEASSNASRATTAEQQVAAMRSGALATIVAGQEIGRDAIRWDGTRFVRDGERVRITNGVVNSRIRFTNGQLADQTITVLRDNGKPNFTGAIRNSRPDGPWLWHDSEGTPFKREIWKDGRLESVEDVTVARDGTITGRRVSSADRAAWVRLTAPVFINLPELIRDTSTPPAAPPTPPAGSGSGKAAPARP
jgi:hypothetical protein